MRYAHLGSCANFALPFASVPEAKLRCRETAVSLRLTSRMHSGATRAVRACGGETANLSFRNGRLRFPPRPPLVKCNALRAFGQPCSLCASIRVRSRSQTPAQRNRGFSTPYFKNAFWGNPRCPRGWRGNCVSPPLPPLPLGTGVRGYGATINGHALRASRLRRGPPPGVAGRSPVKPRGGIGGRSP